MDSKASRVFIKTVVVHLQKSLRSYDDKDQEQLVGLIEDHVKMIKMASGMKKGASKKKRGEKKSKKRPAHDMGQVAVVVVPDADTVSK